MDEKYSVLEPIGSGGFARVYHGKRKSDGCDVAIKIVSNWCAANWFATRTHFVLSSLLTFPPFFCDL